jgi:hypothetical protein
MDVPDIELSRGFRGWFVKNATFKNIAFVIGVVVVLTIYYQETRTFQVQIEKRVATLEADAALNREGRDTLYRKMDVLQERLDNVSHELNAAREDIRDISRVQRR